MKKIKIEKRMISFDILFFFAPPALQSSDTFSLSLILFAILHINYITLLFRILNLWKFSNTTFLILKTYNFVISIIAAGKRIGR
jgi:hypothetical protein